MRTRISWCAALMVAASAFAATTPTGLVVLLTDYGADSVYVGALKGAVYTKFPAARIDAISNSVPPFDVVTGAFMLVEASKEFPPGTTFCCVVDPGVGTERKCVVLETKSGHFFVGPDNGLLSLAAQKLGVVEVRECSNRALWREGKLSHTFHGRDIFGPVAAALASGVSLEKVGPVIEALKRLDLGEVRIENGAAQGCVARSDPYGNLITNISYEDLTKLGLEKDDIVTVTIGKAEFQAPLKQTYSDVPDGKRVGLIQSFGYLEFAVNMGSLADEVKEGAHAPVTVRKAQ
jgi:hypothetical protein